MMQRVAAVTVLRGDGECEAFFNGERDKVIEAVRAEMKSQQEQAKTVEHSRNRLLARQSAELNGRLNSRRGPLRRLWSRLGDAWALAWGIIIVWGEALHLWVREDD